MQNEFYDLACSMLEELEELEKLEKLKEHEVGNPRKFLFKRTPNSPEISSVKLWKAILENAFVGNGRERISKYLLEVALGVLSEKEHNNDAVMLAELLMEDANAPALNEVAKTIMDNFLTPLRNKGKRSKTEAQPTGQLERDSQFRRNLLVRDGSRCLVTRRPGHEIPVLQRANEFPAYLEGAHIIPHSAANKIDVLNFIEDFTGGSIPAANIQGAGINHVRNGLLLQADAHADFDEYLWGVDAQNGIYTAVSTSDPPLPLSFPIQAGAQFQFPNALAGQLPSEDYCQLHLAIGRIFAATTAGQVADGILADG